MMEVTCPFCNEDHMPGNCEVSPFGKYFLTQKQLDNLKWHLKQISSGISKEKVINVAAIGTTLEGLEKWGI